MSITRAQPLNGRNARFILDRARNPKEITLHAARRFIQDATRVDPGYGTDFVVIDPPISPVRRATIEIKLLCRRAKKIYRGKNTFILHSPPWWIFYRDDSVVTVMHDQSQRRF